MPAAVLYARPCRSFDPVVNDASSQECISYLEKRFEGTISSIREYMKEDLEMLNHLSGKKASFLRLSFRTVTQLMDVRKQLQPIIERNAKQKKKGDHDDDTGVALPCDVQLCRCSVLVLAVVRLSAPVCSLCACPCATVVVRVSVCSYL